jgi:hypothetical protein
VVYASDGSAWAYVNPAPRTYVRARIAVATIQGDLAVLSDGPAGPSGAGRVTGPGAAPVDRPADGTAVVTRGAPELLGAEAEIAGEE